ADVELVHDQVLERHGDRVRFPRERARVDHLRRPPQPARLLPRARVGQLTTAELEAVVVPEPQTQCPGEEAVGLGVQGLTPYDDLHGFRPPAPDLRQTPTDGDSAERAQDYSSRASQRTPSGGRVSSAE